MNNYREITLKVTPFSEVATDIMAALLAEIGYESFTPEEDGMKAYIKEELYDLEQVKGVLADFPMEVEIALSDLFVEGKDWNEEWEKNYFQPIVLGNECVIHSTFHKDVPVAKYDIVIDPRMAFGTGHHATTSLMLGEILKAEFAGKSVLDMGCGTAVLAILAMMRGADRATAIDIDIWAYENAKDHVLLNNIEGIEVLHGAAELLSGRVFDVVLANINRNILVNDLHTYAESMSVGATIYMSGFYVEDIPVIRKEAEKQSLVFDYFQEKDNWAVVKFVKE